MPEPITSFASFVASFILKLAISIMPAAMGAALSLKFLGSEITPMQRLTSFITGLLVAVYVSPMLCELLAIQGEKTSAGIQFLVGLFALATARELFKEINSADLIGALKRKFFGGDAA